MSCPSSALPQPAGVPHPALPVEGLHPAPPVEGVQLALLVEGARPALPAEGVQPALPAEGVQPALPAEGLHPALWRAHQLARPPVVGLSSGFAALDAELPGGGWPTGALTELLLPHAGVGELRLLAPVLRAVQAQQRCLMWFDPPAAPCAWALGALGLDTRRLVVVHARQAAGALAGRPPAAQRGRVQGAARRQLPAADVLWALEQALKSGHLGAAVAWLPAPLPADALRRLQLAAQAHDGPVFLLRDDSERQRPSPAPLRLGLASAGPEQLRVQLLKRRGPPQAQPLLLALPPVLAAPVLQRAQRAWAALGVVTGHRLSPVPGSSAPGSARVSTPRPVPMPSAG